MWFQASRQEESVILHTCVSNELPVFVLPCITRKWKIFSGFLPVTEKKPVFKNLGVESRFLFTFMWNEVCFHIVRGFIEVIISSLTPLSSQFHLHDGYIRCRDLPKQFEISVSVSFFGILSINRAARDNIESTLTEEHGVEPTLIHWCLSVAARTCPNDTMTKCHWCSNAADIE